MGHWRILLKKKGSVIWFYKLSDFTRLCVDCSVHEV